MEELTLKVILDSSFLFIPSKFHIDIFEELLNLLDQRFSPILLSVTYQELATMANKGSPKTRKQASLALRLSQRCRIVRVKQDEEERHDDVVVRIAQQWNCPVATNDRSLRERLRRKEIPVIFLREKTRLALEGAS